MGLQSAFRHRFNHYFSTLACSLFMALPTYVAASDVSNSTHKQHVGDFTGDRIADVFYQGKASSETHSSFRLNTINSTSYLIDTWLNGAYGRDWDASSFNVFVEDFNYDTLDDVLLQNRSTGDSFIAYANPKADPANTTASQDNYRFINSNTIPDNHLGLTWNAKTSTMVVGAFLYPGLGFYAKKRWVFLQGKEPDNDHKFVYLTDGYYVVSDVPDTVGQTITDGYLGLKWDSRHVKIHVGDFNGDGADDFFLQPKRNLTMIMMDDLVIPISDGYGTSAIITSNISNYQLDNLYQTWENGYLGIDWYEDQYNVIIGDFNGNGRDDIFLQAKSAGSSHKLLISDSNHKFTTITQTFSDGYLGLDWSSSLATVSAGDMNGDYKDDLIVLGADGSTTVYAEANGQFTQTSTVSQTVHQHASHAHRTGAIVPGLSSGGFSVGVSGAASYSMGITVPPGQGGMQPSLGLSYSNQSGNGIMGMGWSMSGLSTIMRCPKNYAEDGVVADINFTNSDSLCLDGQRLRVVNGVPYGTTGAEYRTEVDNFSRIIQMGGNIDTNNAWFKIETKAGQTYSYGNTEESRANLKSITPTYLWMVKTIEDAAGNTIDVDYHEDSLAGHFRVNRINYTSINGGPASVRFFYESRPDPIEGFVQGSPIVTTQRLAAVETYVGDNFVRSTEIFYDSSPSTDRSRVTSIQECAYDNTCLTPVNFNWQQYASNWPSSSLHIDTRLCANNDNRQARPASSCYFDDRTSIRYADVSGDGLSDMCYHHESGLRCYLSTGNDFDYANPILTGICNNAGSSDCDTSWARDSVTYVDVNNDNKADLLYRSNAGLKVHISNGNSFGAAIVNSNILVIPYECTPAGLSGDFPCYEPPAFAPTMLDLNADGRADMCYRDGVKGMQCYLGNGSGTFTAITGINTAGICKDGDGGCNDTDNHQTIQLVDVNGDGLPDLTYRHDSAGMRYHPGTGTSFGSPVDSNICRNGDGCDLVSIRLADVTGDGMPDICARKSTGIDCYVNLGGQFQANKLYQTGRCKNGDGCDRFSIQYTDLNQDGRADLVYRHTSGLQSYLSKVNLDSLFVKDTQSDRCADSPVTYGCDSADDNYYTVQYTDINGDGALDQALRGDDGVHIFLAAGFKQDVITTITDGYNNTTSIIYQPLTDPAVYSQGSCVNAYPIQCVVGPMQVVREYTASNGVGGTSLYQYHYQDLRAHIRGRGFMGFGLINKYDLTNNTREEIYDDNYTSATFNDTGYPDTYLYKGMGTRKLSYGPGDVLLSKTVNTFDYQYTTGAAYFPYYDTSSEETYSPEGMLLSTVLINNNYSPDHVKHGNISQITTTTTDHVNNVTFTNTVNNTWEAAILPGGGASWHLGRVASTTATHATTMLDANGQPIPSVTKASSFTYNNLGLLETSTIEPGIPTLNMTTTYGYDIYGNRDSVTVEGGQSGTLSYVPTRASTTTISNDLVSLNVTTTATNALLQSETSILDARNGSVLNLTGPNGLTTAWVYDGFGRQLEEHRADGTNSYTDRYLCNSNCPAGTVFYIINKSDGSPASTTYFDQMGRDILSLTTDLDDNVIYTYKEYNGKGQVEKTYDVGLAPPATAAINLPLANYKTAELLSTAQYDVFNRITKVTDHRLGNVTLYTHNGLTATTTVQAVDENGSPLPDHITSKSAYANGWTKQSVDANGGAVLYFYDVQGNLTETHSPGATLASAVNKVKMGYDHAGRKISMIDPDMGNWSYEYDAAGKLIRQTDAQGNVTHNVYDILDRQVLRIEKEGVSKWNYDDAPGKGIGKLAMLAGPISISTTVYNNYIANPPDPSTIDETTAVFQRSYVYDNLGRGKTVSTYIEGRTFRMDTNYDVNSSRVVSVAYPLTPSNQRLVVSNSFHGADNNTVTRVDRALYAVDTNGDPTTVVAGSNQLVWQLGDSSGYTGAINKRGQIIKETVGNNITTNHVYDISGRLTARTAGGVSSIQNNVYVYDSINNLKRREDNLPDPGNSSRTPMIETFSYDTLNRVTGSSLTGLPGQSAPITSTFEYFANGNLKHKQDAANDQYYWYESARPHAVTRTSSDAAGNNTLASYLYNNNGSMTSGDGRSLQYTSFNKPNVIDKNGYVVQLDYGPDHNRYKQSNSEGVTYYLSARYDAGTHFEQEITGTGTKNVHYLYGGSGLVGTFSVDNSNAQQARYFHKDNLGSIEVITDETQQVRAKVGFAAFGQRRDGLNNLIEDIGVNDRVTLAKIDNHHWYTGHEHLEQTGLIHMNGRVYDPKLGRFLSADPTIQMPAYSQSYNRYSYVMNNPLNATDPSGYSAAGTVGDALEGIAKVIGGLLMSNPMISSFVAADRKGRQQSKTYRQAANIAAFVFAAAFPNVAPAVMAYNSAMNTWVAGGDARDIAVSAAVAYVTAELYAEIGSAYNTGLKTNGAQGISGTTAVFAHGMVGGMTSGMQGGSFKTGFISGAIGKAVTINLPGSMDIVAKGVVVAIGGGVAAELGGGKFSNGARTAAIGYVLNHLANKVARSVVKKLWRVTPSGTSKVMRHSKFGKFYKSKSDKSWWSKDRAGHGDSVWKVFREEEDGLRWVADADEYGQFITDKFKSDTGRFIPFKELSVVTGWEKAASTLVTGFLITLEVTDPFTYIMSPSPPTVEDRLPAFPESR